MAAAPATARSAAPHRPVDAPRRDPAVGRGRAAANRPDLRVVAPPRRARRWVTAMVLTALVGVVGITSLSAASAEAAFVATELDRDIAALERAHDTLTGDVAELSSLERIQRVATEELGMVPVEQARYVEGAPVDQVPAAHHGDEPADPVKAARRGRW